MQTSIQVFIKQSIIYHEQQFYRSAYLSSSTMRPDWLTMNCDTLIKDTIKKFISELKTDYIIGVQPLIANPELETKVDLVSVGMKKIQVRRNSVIMVANARIELVKKICTECEFERDEAFEIIEELLTKTHLDLKRDRLDFSSSEAYMKSVEEAIQKLFT